MQLKIYKENDIEKKLKTRELYEENFDIGDKEFIDYYYDTIIRRNIVVAIEDGDGKVIAMVHLNPYIYSILGMEFNVHYLVAVATKNIYRGKGYMRDVLNAAINYLTESKEPFCYIVPENDRLKNTYHKFGFEEVSKFTVDKFSNDTYDIYPVKTEEYLNLMKKEQLFLDLETEEYKEDLKNKIVMMKILNSDISPLKTMSDFKSKKIYVCQEV